MVPPKVNPVIRAAAPVNLAVRELIPIKYPTIKKGEKRVARPPNAPVGARGPIKAKLSGAKVEKAMSLADQLAA